VLPEQHLDPMLHATVQDSTRTRGRRASHTQFVSCFFSILTVSPYSPPPRAARLVDGGGHK